MATDGTCTPVDKTPFSHLNISIRTLDRPARKKEKEKKKRTAYPAISLSLPPVCLSLFLTWSPLYWHWQPPVYTHTLCWLHTIGKNQPLYLFNCVQDKCSRCDVIFQFCFWKSFQFGCCCLEIKRPRRKSTHFIFYTTPSVWFQQSCYVMAEYGSTWGGVHSKRFSSFSFSIFVRVVFFSL